MFRLAFQHPQVAAWAGKLSRIPRWGWIAVGIGVGVPIVLLLGGLLVIAALSGLAVFVVALAIVSVLRVIRRLASRRTTELDDGRRNVRLVVGDVRVRSVDERSTH